MAKRPERLSPDRQVTVQDIDCLKEAFKLFDCDRDGEITVEELGKVSNEADRISLSDYGAVKFVIPYCLALGVILFWPRQVSGQRLAFGEGPACNSTLA